MRFLVDAQLPPVLARWLREAGHEADHVEDLNLRDAEDRVIWVHALQANTAVVTKDEDFAATAAREANAPVVVWLRVGNTTNRALKEWIDLRLPGIVTLAGQGHRLIEVI